MKRSKFEKIEKLFEEKEEFSLTIDQYKEKTGKDFPKGKSYAEKHSAIARRAKEYGFKVVVVPHHIEFKKIGDN